MATRAAYLGQVIAQSHMEKAIEEVAASEQGIILNDHYDLSRYVLRRATYLGNSSLQKAPGTKWFRFARSDAAEVFDTASQELSVQEVRRRELREEIEPLLPLTTTENTQTIDSFRSFPQAEWTSEEQIQSQASEILLISTQVNSSRTAPIEGLLKNSLETSPQSLPQRSTINALPTLSSTKASNKPDLTANTAMAVNKPQQTEQGRLSDMSSSPLPDTSFSSSFAIDPRLTADTTLNSMEDNDTLMQLEGAETRPPADPELIMKIIDRLGKKSPSNATTAAKEHVRTSDGAAAKVPQKLYYSEGVSALANRGMSVPIKTVKRARNATPDPSEGSIEDDDISPTSEEAQPPAAKKRKVAASKKVASAVVVLRINPASVQAATSAPPKASRKKAPAIKLKVKPNHIERVISGNALPRTVAEATSAAETRLARLLANHNVSKKASKRHRVAAGAEPDFMPEYFNIKNFPKTEDTKIDDVRCACGVVVDDEQGFIACDKCGVWQHQDCMGDAVPENTNKGKYFCHVCEPWVHRELVARLRRENPLV